VHGDNTDTMSSESGSGKAPGRASHSGAINSIRPDSSLGERLMPAFCLAAKALGGIALDYVGMEVF